MRSYLDALARYFEFSGRTSRSQYWLYHLVVVVLVLAVVGYQYHAARRLPDPDNLSPLLIFLSVFHAIPTVTATVRRLHDIGKSGWWYLLNLVPFGAFFLLFWTCRASDAGSRAAEGKVRLGGATERFI